MTVTVQTMVARAWALFRFDQPSLAAPFFSDGATRLGKKFEFDEVGTELRPQDNTRVWLARSGRVTIEGRDRKIAALQGHPLDMLIEVRVDKPAVDMSDGHKELQACYEFLAGEDAPRLASIADVLNSTTAVVKLDHPMEAFVPFAKRVGERYRARLGGEHPLSEPLVRFNLEMTSVVRGRRINQGITFEPRSPANAADQMYFTQSALPPFEHLELLKEIVRARS
jgi:hypothetical protein